MDTIEGTFGVEAVILSPGQPGSFVVPAVLLATSPGSTTLNARIGHWDTFTVDAIILAPVQNFRVVWADYFDRTVSGSLGGDWTVGTSTGSGVDGSYGYANPGYQVNFLNPTIYALPLNEFDALFDFRTQDVGAGSNLYVSWRLGNFYVSVDPAGTVTGSPHQYWLSLYSGGNAFQAEALTWYRVRARQTATEILARVWKVGDPEPSTWLNTKVRTAGAYDRLYVYGATSATTLIDNFEILSSIPIPLDAYIVPRRFTADAIILAPIGGIVGPPSLFLDDFTRTVGVGLGGSWVATRTGGSVDGQAVVVTPDTYSYYTNVAIPAAPAGGWDMVFDFLNAPIHVSGYGEYFYFEYGAVDFDIWSSFYTDPGDVDLSLNSASLTVYLSASTWFRVKVRFNPATNSATLKVWKRVDPEPATWTMTTTGRGTTYPFTMELDGEGTGPTKFDNLGIYELGGSDFVPGIVLDAVIVPERFWAYATIFGERTGSKAIDAVIRRPGMPGSFLLDYHWGPGGSFSSDAIRLATFAGKTYQQNILDDNPLHFWRSNETTGTVAADSGSSPVVGTIKSGVTLGVEGRPGYPGGTAFQYPAALTTGYVWMNGVSVNFAAYSIEAWVYLTGGSGAIAGRGYSPGLMLYWTGGTVYVYHEGSGPSASVSANVWHHVVATWDGVYIRIYVDGVAGSPSARSGAPTDNASYVWAIGAYNATSSSSAAALLGKIDEVAFYAYTLTQAQISRHYAGSTAGLITASAMISNGHFRLDAYFVGAIVTRAVIKKPDNLGSFTVDYGWGPGSSFTVGAILLRTFEGVWTAPSYWLDDFNRTVALGSGWGGTWAASYPYYAGVDGSRGYVSGSQYAYAYNSIIDSVVPATWDATIEFETPPVGGSTSWRVAWQIPSTYFNVYPYTTIASPTSAYRVYLYAKGLSTNTTTLQLAPATWYRARVQQNVGTSYIRIWKVGDPEPGTWLLSRTQSTSYYNALLEVQNYATLGPARFDNMGIWHLGAWGTAPGLLLDAVLEYRKFLVGADIFKEQLGATTVNAVIKRSGTPGSFPVDFQWGPGGSFPVAAIRQTTVLGGTAQSVILGSNPAAYWPFSDLTTTTATELVSGNTATPLTPANISSATVDGIGKGWQWSAQSRLASNFYQPSTSAATVEVWIKTTCVGEIWQGRNGDSGSGGRGISLSLQGNTGGGFGGIDGHLQFFINSDGILVGVRTDAAYNDNVLHHVVAVWTSSPGAALVPSQFKIYVDGAEVAVAAMDNGRRDPAPFTGNPTHGYFLGYGYGVYTGFAAHLAFYTRSLTLDEITRHYRLSGMLLSADIRRYGEQMSPFPNFKVDAYHTGQSFGDFAANAVILATINPLRDRALGIVPWVRSDDSPTTAYCLTDGNNDTPWETPYARYFSSGLGAAIFDFGSPVTMDGWSYRGGPNYWGYGGGGFYRNNASAIQIGSSADPSGVWTTVSSANLPDSWDTGLLFLNGPVTSRYWRFQVTSPGTWGSVTNRVSLYGGGILWVYALKLATLEGSFGLEAMISNGHFTLDAIKGQTFSGTIPTSADVFKVIETSFPVDARYEPGGTFSISSLLLKTYSTTEITTRDVALFKPVLVNSTYAGAAANVVDGNDSTYHHSDSSVTGRWLRIDLQTPQQIVSYRLYQPLTEAWRASSVVMEYSSDDATWYTSSADSGLGVENYRAIQYPAIARYWRIRATAGGSNGWQVNTLSLYAGPISFAVSAWRAGAIIVDAAIYPHHFRVDAQLGYWFPASAEIAPRHFHADAIRGQSFIGSFPVAAIRFRTFPKTTTANAVQKRNQTGSLTVDARIMPRFSVDAQVGLYFWANAVQKKPGETVDPPLGFTVEAFTVLYFYANAFVQPYFFVNASFCLEFHLNAVILSHRGAPSFLPLAFPGTSQTFLGQTANSLTSPFWAVGDERMTVIVGSPPSDGGSLDAFNSTSVIRYTVSAAPGEHTFDVLTGLYTINSAKDNTYRPSLTGSGYYSNWGVSSLSFTLNCFVLPTFRVDANLVWTWHSPEDFPPLTADALVLARWTKSFVAATYIQPFFIVRALVVPRHFHADAWIKCEIRVDAWLIRRVVGGIPTNAFVKPYFRVNAIRRKTYPKTFTVGSWFTNPRYGNFNVGAWVLLHFHMDAQLRLTKYRTFKASAWRIRHVETSTTADAYVQPWFTLSARIYRPEFNVDAIRLETFERTFEAGANFVWTWELTTTADAFVQPYFFVRAMRHQVGEGSFTAKSAIVWKIYGSFTVGARLTGFHVNAIRLAPVPWIFNVFAFISIMHPVRSMLVQAEKRDPGAYWDPYTETWLHQHFLADASICIPVDRAFAMDAAIIVDGLVIHSTYVDAWFRNPESISEFLLEAEISTLHTVVYEGDGETRVVRRLVSGRLSFPGTPNPLWAGEDNALFGPFWPPDFLPVTVTIWDPPSTGGNIGIYSVNENKGAAVSSGTFVFWPSYYFEPHYVYSWDAIDHTYTPNLTGSGMVTYYRDDTDVVSLPAPTLDSWIVGTVGDPFTLDAEVIGREKTGFFYLAADFRGVGEKRGAFDAGAHLLAPQVYFFSTGAWLVWQGFTADAVLYQPNIAVDAYIQPFIRVNAVILVTRYPGGPKANAVLVRGQGSGSFAVGSDVILNGERRAAFTLEASILGSLAKRFYLVASIALEPFDFALEAMVAYNFKVEAWLGEVGGGLGGFSVGAYVRSNSIIIFPPDGGDPTDPLGGWPAINRSFRVKIEAFIPDPIPIGNDDDIEELITKILEAEAELDALYCAVANYSSQGSTSYGVSSPNPGGTGYTGSLPNAISQIGYPGASDIDDCWVVATVWAAIASGQTYYPSVPTFRAYAQNPDRPVPTGGTLDHIMRGARGSWPGAGIRRYASPDWNGFVSLLKGGWTASLAVRSSGLPSSYRYGFNGLHQVGVAYSNGSYYIMNPLQSNGSSPRQISGEALRTAARGFTGGTICAAVFA